MAIFLLVRHGAHSLLGKTLVGRAGHVGLSERGARQAALMATRLASLPVKAIYSSPLTRAKETAEPIGRRLGLPVQVAEAINEVDFGHWSGRSFDDLQDLPEWRLFNTFRTGTRIPGGELIIETQTRIVAFICALARERPDDHIVLVSHGDVIKAALAYFMGLHLDFFHRFEISPGSISTLQVAAYGAIVIRLNEVVDDDE